MLSWIALIVSPLRHFKLKRRNERTKERNHDRCYFTALDVLLRDVRVHVHISGCGCACVSVGVCLQRADLLVVVFFSFIVPSFISKVLSILQLLPQYFVQFNPFCVNHCWCWHRTNKLLWSQLFTEHILCASHSRSFSSFSSFFPPTCVYVNRTDFPYFATETLTNLINDSSQFLSIENEYMYM